MMSSLFASLLDTLTLGWRTHTGWAFWYGAGASLTGLLLVVRIAPSVGRFFRETQWSLPALVMASVVWTVGPFTALAAVTFAWPLVLVLLVRRAAR